MCVVHSSGNNWQGPIFHIPSHWLFQFNNNKHVLGCFIPSGFIPIVHRAWWPNRCIWSLVHTRVEQMTYNIDTCHFLDWWSALIVCIKGWLAQCRDNVTKWDIESWCQQPAFSLGKTYTLPCVCTVTTQHPS